MRTSQRDLIVTAILAGLGMVVGLLPEIPVVRPLLAVPLVLILPGYALVRAGMPGRVARAELALLSVSGSLAFGAVFGVILGLAGVPLTTRTWAVLFGIATLLGAAVAAVRRARVPAASAVDEAPAAARVARRPWNVEWRRIPMFKAALVACAVVVTGVALYASPRSINEQPRTSLTQLWVLPDTELPGGGVRVGVTNGEAVPVTYRLELRDGATVVVAWPKITLDPGQSWQDILDASVPRDRNVLALLTRPDQPGFERFVLLSPAVAS